MPGHYRGNQGMMTKKQKQEGHETLSNKQVERDVREAYRRERKLESYLADDENFPRFATHLSKMGLQLRDIPGDGNCLFRALGDQLEGHCRNHFRHRQDVARYMQDHREDFEPFIEDDIPFDAHIQNLKKLGVYAGNDAIVAFARFHQVNIIIHQLSAKHLMITGSPNPGARQLHISYHNGDHYSSIRKLHDNTESPTDIRIQDVSESKDTGNSAAYTNTNAHASMENGGGYVRVIRGCQTIEQEVVSATNCTDLKMVRDTLMDVHYDADAAIAHLLQIMDLTDNNDEDSLSTTPSQQTSTDSGVWSDAGLRLYGTTYRKGQRVHFREDSLGGSSGYGSMNSNSGGARAKLYTPVPQSGRLSASQKSRTKKMEKKMRAEERHRQKFIGGKQPQLVPAGESNQHTFVSRTTSLTMI